MSFLLPSSSSSVSSFVVRILLLSVTLLRLACAASVSHLVASQSLKDATRDARAFEQLVTRTITTISEHNDEFTNDDNNRQQHHAAAMRVLIDHHSQMQMTLRQRSSNNNNATTNHLIAFPFTCGDPTSSSSSSFSNRRVRKDLRDLTPLELRRWRTVMRTLMTQRPSNASFNPPPSFWDLLVAVHIVFGSEAHNGAYFLPWHRFFLLYLENHIRANHFPNFALPYWDWSHTDSNDPSQSAVWGADMLGGSAFEADATNITQAVGFGSGAPIPNGPFRGTSAHYLDSHPVRRGFNSTRPGSMRPLVNSSVLSELIHRKLTTNWTWGMFSDAVETAHNRVHADIGGDMLITRTSPNDPVFYVHHAFVDSVWWERQRVHGWREFGGNHSFPAGSRGNGSSVSEMQRTENVSSEFVFRYFNLSVRDSFEQDCVTYQRYRPTGRERGGGGGSSSTSGTRTEGSEDVCGETDMMSVERCRNGEAVLESAAAAAAAGEDQETT